MSNYSTDAAEQVVRLSMEGADYALRIAGKGAEKLAVLLYAILKDQKRTKGKMRLANMLRSGKELKVFAVRDQELQKFCTEAKKYGVPVLCTMSFEESGRTMFGNSVEDMAEELGEVGVDGIGLNCSLGPDKAAPIMKQFAEATDMPLVFKPNAGLPVMDENGNMVNPYTKEDFAREVADIVPLLSYVGGCCGTDPSYIALMKEKFK